MQLRQIPKLAFVYDQSIERGIALSQLIETAVSEDRAHHDPQAEGEPPPADT
jgi:ribosome-binding factor A